LDNYIQEVLRTESKDLKLIEDRICNLKIIRLDHAADGMCTEAGEFKDVLKKWKYYGKEIDLINLEEELGDLCYYIGLACDVLGTDFDKIQRKNINKLKARYSEKFTENEGINRNLDIERQVLEGLNDQK
jgi:NTP pyrophosphatase (non-canonical NTP hydrolase)